MYEKDGITKDEVLTIVREFPNQGTSLFVYSCSNNYSMHFQIPHYYVFRVVEEVRLLQQNLFLDSIYYVGFRGLNMLLNMFWFASDCSFLYFLNLFCIICASFQTLDKARWLLASSAYNEIGHEFELPVRKLGSLRGKNAYMRHHSKNMFSYYNLQVFTENVSGLQEIW